MEKINLDLEKFENFTDKGKEKIAEIGRIAAEVFSEKGYLNATLADVAHAAGITKGGVFHYFSTKEELLFLIIYRHLDKALNNMKSKLDTCDSNHEKISIFIQNHINNYRDNQAESRLALHERGNLPEKHLRIIKEKEREYVGILKAIIEKLMTRRKQNAKNATLITYSLLGMLTWPYAWFNPKGKSTPEELSELIYKIFVGDLNIPQSGERKRSPNRAQTVERKSGRDKKN